MVDLWFEANSDAADSNVTIHVAGHVSLLCSLVGRLKSQLVTSS